MITVAICWFLLEELTADCDDVTDDVIIADPALALLSTADCDEISNYSLRLVPQLVMITVAICWFLLEELTADCDDVTDDVIIADPALALLSTADCDEISTDVIVADIVLALLV
ncbi:F-box/LRR-repeat protein 14 [Dorcoceras hygrometricum]|uniref:F-box/LRR-repeat protein 14 n=1 Tax=Dorcoceras hygrometricum TaxID=472368 RepID=A0A2Z7BTK3_9LAMI|nr:F-box/LRR-repeat protein 14 [Dorcoceras hygrometricum]